MSRFVEGQDRLQVTLLPECPDDFVAEDNPIRVVDAFVGALNLAGLGFDGSKPVATGRPPHRPAVLFSQALVSINGSTLKAVTAPGLIPLTAKPA